MALPAYWLWRRAADTGSERRHSSLQCLLALGCMLVLLFPVISATDDVHAMRAEMEDSAVSKRAVRQAGSEKNSAWLNRLQSPPARVSSAGWLAAPEVSLHDFVAAVRPLPARPSLSHAGRAPPFSCLG